MTKDDKDSKLNPVDFIFKNAMEGSDEDLNSYFRTLPPPPTNRVLKLAHHFFNTGRGDKTILCLSQLTPADADPDQNYEIAMLYDRFNLEKETLAYLAKAATSLHSKATESLSKKTTLSLDLIESYFTANARLSPPDTLKQLKQQLVNFKKALDEKNKGSKSNRLFEIPPKKPGSPFIESTAKNLRKRK